MDVSAIKRIDAGLKRGPRPRKDPQRTKPLTPKVWTSYPTEVRQNAVQTAIQSLEAGLTTNEIAAKLGIPGQTLRFWLLNDPKADQARNAMFDYELTLRGELIDSAEDALALGRAREGFRYWSFLAERRDHSRYGQKQELHVTNEPLSQVDRALLGSAQELLTLFKQRVEKVVEPEKIPNEIKE